MHYAMAFRQIAAANALEVLGADVLQENRRGETTTAVAGIGIALASHLNTTGKGRKARKGKSSSGASVQWRSSMDREMPEEGKADDGDSDKEPLQASPPPQRQAVAPPSRQAAVSKPSRPSAKPAHPPPGKTPAATHDKDDDSYSDDDNEEAEESSSSSALVAAAEELAAEERQTANSPLKPVGGARRPVRGASRPAGGASRPASRPSHATSTLKAVAADLEED